MSSSEAQKFSEEPQLNESLDVKQLMAEIRERIRVDVEAHKDSRPEFKPYKADAKGQERAAGDLLQSPDLLKLNQMFAQDIVHNSDHIKSHRGGVIGGVIDKFKRKIHGMIVGMFENYYASEKDFKAHLVRHLNDTAKYVDSRDMANFWELIRKIDVDVQKSLDRIERINDEQMGALRSQERRVNETVQQGVIDLKDRVARHEAEIKTLEGVARGLEGIVARMGKAQKVSSDIESSANQSTPDHSYLLLENRFRGSEEEIKKRMVIYPPHFAGASKPVLEIGQGRGELLELFKEQGIPAYGVDLDQAMTDAAIVKGLDAKVGDGLAHLHSLEDNSLGGVIAIQVVEHLTQAQLEELFQLCMAKVVPGGKVIFETINPRSLLALSSNYFRDPTHVWPLHPDTLEYTMNLAGLKTLSIDFLSPVTREAQLRDVPVEEYMSPRWSHAIRSINMNFEQLNSLIYGDQDYCIVAEVS